MIDAVDASSRCDDDCAVVGAGRLLSHHLVSQWGRLGVGWLGVYIARVLFFLFSRVSVLRLVFSFALLVDGCISHDIRRLADDGASTLVSGSWARCAEGAFEGVGETSSCTSRTAIGNAWNAALSFTHLPPCSWALPLPSCGLWRCLHHCYWCRAA